MKSRQRRLKTIELDLTPQQVVVLWLRNALLAGTFEEGARRTPRPREAVGNAVRNTVRNISWIGRGAIWQPIRTGLRSWKSRCDSGDGCGTNVFLKVSVSSNWKSMRVWDDCQNHCQRLCRRKRAPCKDWIAHA